MTARSPGLVGCWNRFRAAARPCGRRGRRHPLAGLLVITAAALLAGARSFATIGRFSPTLPQATLARLGTWQRPCSTWHVAPSETTLRCVLQRVDADELDRVVGGWLAEQAAADCGPIAVDGKVCRAAPNAPPQRADLLRPGLRHRRACRRRLSTRAGPHIRAAPRPSSKPLSARASPCCSTKSFRAKADRRSGQDVDAGSPRPAAPQRMRPARRFPCAWPVPLSLVRSFSPVTSSTRISRSGGAPVTTIGKPRATEAPHN